MKQKDKLTKIARILINPDITEDNKLDQIKAICLIEVKSRLVPIKEFKYRIDQVEDRIKKKSGFTVDHINQLTGRECIWRQMAHYMAWKHTNQSLKAIGQYFGNKDHSTVLNSVKVISNYLETDRNFREQYQDFLNN